MRNFSHLNRAPSLKRSIPCSTEAPKISGGQDPVMKSCPRVCLTSRSEKLPLHWLAHPSWLAVAEGKQIPSDGIVRNVQPLRGVLACPYSERSYKAASRGRRGTDFLLLEFYPCRTIRPEWTSVQLSERKNGLPTLKRHQIKHLEFVLSWFGTRGLEVQILPPRPTIIVPSFQELAGAPILHF